MTITHTGGLQPMSSEEARGIVAEELRRFVALCRSLAEEDWHQPTACTAWSVRDIVAHQAGSWASYARWGEFFRQLVFNPYVLQADNPVDGVNRRQVEDRQERTTTELLAELEAAGPKAINTRQGLPGLLRGLRAKLGDPGGKTSIGDLMDRIYTRDIWTHRMDICEAAGRAFHQTAAHDGRINADILHDIARTLRPHLAGRTADLHLSGEGGGGFRFGPDVQPGVRLSIDMVTFHKVASRRVEPDAALFEIEGDADLAHTVIQHARTLY